MEFDTWFPIVCYLAGVLTGSTIQFLLNRKSIKKLEAQSMQFIDMIAKLASQTIKLDKVARQLITLIDNLLKKG